MSQRASVVVAAVFFITVLGVMLWFGTPEGPSIRPADRVYVVTTIYPIEDVVRHVGGDQVFVRNMVPAGAEPHDYEPTPRDITELLEADVLLFVGGGIDEQVEAMAGDVAAQGGIVRGLEEYIAFFNAEEPEEQHAEGEDEHGHEGVDPHIWLDPVLMQEVVMVVRDTLIAADPEQAAVYRANADLYIADLLKLDAAYALGLQDCQLNDIIVSHDAFGYLGRRYGITVHAVSGLSPEAEPSVRDLTELAQTARELGVQVIFFETLVSPRLAETLAQEIGAEIAVLNPLEGLSQEEIRHGEDYLSVMYNNLEALRGAMVCQ